MEVRCFHPIPLNPNYAGAWNNKGNALYNQDSGADVCPGWDLK